MKILTMIAAILVHGIFWFWNTLFLIVACTFLIPHLALPSISGTLAGSTPLSFAIYSVLCIVFPIICFVTALFKFKKDTATLTRIFFGFELPLFFLLLLRIVMLRDMNNGLVHLLFNFTVAFCAFIYLQCWSTNTTPSFRQSYLRFSLACIVLMVGVYFALLLLPFAIPLLFEFITVLFSWDFWAVVTQFLLNPLTLVFVLLAVATSGLFLISPLLVVYFYLKTFVTEYQSAVGRAGKSPLIAIAAGIMVVNLALFITLNQQPQPAVFAALEEIEKQGLHPGQIEDKLAAREGLVNAYLAAWRYVSPQATSNAVTRSFQNAFGSDTSAIAIASQTLFNTVAKPFLYTGDNFQEEHDKAAEYYAQIFDSPIAKAEKDSILRSIEVTWERESAAAGLINAASETVLVRQQRIDVEVLEGTARVSVFHQLENQTFNPHEVTLHFTLPEEAVLTGLWLSDDPDDLKKYPYVLAPRGAAQQVYNNEVTRRVDPSLLEQVGPRQFRLRAFPVPARTHAARAGGRNFGYSWTKSDAEALFIKFDYETLPTPNGHWPAPVLLEKRNLYWDASTERYLNGETFNEQAWLPKHLGPALDPGKTLATNMGDFVIKATPIGTSSLSTVPLPQGLRFAVLVDGSYSMRSKVDSIKSALAELTQQGVTTATWLCQTSCQTPVTDIGQSAFFGNAHVLQQLQGLQAEIDVSAYDAVVVLTDAGSYELERALTSTPEGRVAAIETLLLVHLNGELPYAYNDQILAMLRHGNSGIATSMTDALRNYTLRIGLHTTAAHSQPILSPQLFAVTENYAWTTEAHDAIGEATASQGLQKMAARRWLHFKANASEPLSLQTLDEIHQLAKQYNIVTDYSSMIVLVNDRQKDALKDAENAADRFDREVETGTEDISSPSDVFSVVAVPEPEEWMLLGIAALFCGVIYRRRKYPSYSIALPA